MQWQHGSIGAAAIFQNVASPCHMTHVACGLRHTVSHLS